MIKHDFKKKSLLLYIFHFYAFSLLHFTCPVLHIYMYILLFSQKIDFIFSSKKWYMLCEYNVCNLHASVTSFIAEIHVYGNSALL